MKSVFFLVPFLFLSFANAQAFCLDKKDIASVMNDFSFYRWDGKNMRNVHKTSLCDQTDSLYKVVDALVNLKQTRKNLPAINASKSVVLQEGPYNFFSKRIHTIVIEDVPTKLCNNTIIAYVLSKAEPNTTYICPRMFNGLGLYRQGATLVHEARHIDGFNHVRCTRGNMKSVGYSCDNNVNEQGSYGVEASFASFMSKNAEDELTRQQARAQAVDYYLNRFNHLPLNIKPGVATFDFSNKLSFFDGTEMFQLAQLPAKASMNVWGNDLSFYYFNGEVQRYSHAPKLTTDLSTLAAGFRLASDEMLKNLIQARISKHYFCLLVDKGISCTNGVDGRGVTLPPEVPPRALVQSSVDSENLSILMMDGTLYDIPPKIIVNQNWTLKDLKKRSSKEVFLDYAQWTTGSTTHTYGLNGTYQLLKRNSRNQWQEATPVKGQRFKQIAPFLWSRTLESL